MLGYIYIGALLNLLPVRQGDTQEKRGDQIRHMSSIRCEQRA